MELLSYFDGAIALKLPVRFKPGPLLSDLRRLPPGCWEIHSKSMDEMLETAFLVRFPGSRGRRTAALRASPAFAAVIRAFRCRLHAARLFKVSRGGVLLRHLDSGLREGILRVHVPIVTNPGVYIVVAGHRVVMRPGEAWCPNTTLNHEVYNLGGGDRIHMILDLVPGKSFWKTHAGCRKVRLGDAAAIKTDVKGLVERRLRLFERQSTARTVKKKLEGRRLAMMVATLLRQVHKVKD